MRYPAFCTLLLTLAVSAAPVSAQETFASLITENTALFVHVDVKKMDINAIKQSWTKYTEELLQSLRFDETSTRSTLSALNKDLDGWDEVIRPTFETITQTLGIQEAALIIDTDYDSERFPVIIAFPWKGKTENDGQTLASLLEKNWKIDIKEYADAGFVVPLGDFLFLVAEGGEPLLQWFDDLKPSESDIMQAMKTLGDDEIKMVLSMTDKLRKRILEEFAETPYFPEPLLNIFTYVARKVDWAAMSIPNPLMAEKQPPYTMTVKTSTAADARQLRAMLNTGIDTLIASWQASMAMWRTWDNNVPEMPQTFYEFSRGYLRTMLPVVEGDKLVFHQPETDPFVELYVKMGSVAFLFPAIEMIRSELARPNTACMNNMRQIGIALHNYHDVYNGLPPLYTVDASGKPLHSWRVLILPFLEQTALYEAIRLDEPWDSEHNKQFHNRIIPQYVCPRNVSAGDKNCHYSVIAGSGFIPAKNERERTGLGIGNITDGMSNTLAVVEVKEAFCWMDPTADITLGELMKGINTEDGRVGSNHRGGTNVIFFDAASFFLTDDIPKEVLRALGTPNGGESESRDWRRNR